MKFSILLMLLAYEYNFIYTRIYILYECLFIIGSCLSFPASCPELDF